MATSSSTIYTNASIKDGKGTNSSILFWDGSHEIASTTISRHDLLVPMIFVGVLSLIGIPGNILVILVFTLKHKSSICRTIILSLAIYDLLVCGITLPFDLYDLFNHYTFREKWVCKIFRTLNYIFVFNSSSMIMLMTVDRYRRVCRAMKRQMSQRMTINCIIVSCFMSAILALPNIFIRGIHTIPLDNNVTGYDCTISDEFISTYIPAAYNGGLFITCVFNILMISILYVFIVQEIYKHFKFLKSFNARKRDKNKRHKCSISTTSCSKDYLETGTFNHTQSSESSENGENTQVTRTNVQLRYTGKSFAKKDSIKMAGTQSYRSYRSTKIAIVISMFYVLSYIPTLGESLIEGIYGETFLREYVSISVLQTLLKSFGINHVINPFIYGFIDKKFRKDCKDIVLPVFKMFCRV